MNEQNENTTEDTKKCPYCAETIKTEAVKCRHCGSYLGGSPMRDEWYRLSEDKKLGGVCAGLAHHFGISVSLLRLAFAIGAFVPTFGIGFLIYIILWIILPERHIGEINRRD
ncbi:PspC domain-containing protein [bacterium]